MDENVVIEMSFAEQIINIFKVSIQNVVGSTNTLVSTVRAKLTFCVIIIFYRLQI